MDKEYLTVKEFAAAAEVTTQYIYKIYGSSLKPYTKTIKKKKYIQAAAIDFIKNGFPEQSNKQPFQPLQSTEMQPDNNSGLQPDNNEEQPTNKTTVQPDNNGSDQNGEIEALKQLIEELCQEKEELKTDKEYLKGEVLKWQQLFVEERNKVKLLETAAASDEIIEYEKDDKENKGFIRKLIGWINRNNSD